MVKVKVLNAVVDGSTTGSIIEIDEQSAKHLAAIKYVEILPQEKDPEEEPKKPATRRRKKTE
ncbi:Uncharacterised protein [Niallia circulans]|nr:hypothetical protein [Niallia circulans]MDR4318682.1 hypothetical protein [Niallia circulans]MED3839357.1 hypothetical protein [Niallia circulans]MED4245340.1 hypothetical protein [Niallia circulans]MED4250875.1 hypothetical protein [Niallia circulans]QKH60155.1 hypothetical protein FOC77_05555 [Niallia circulans]